MALAFSPFQLLDSKWTLHFGLLILVGRAQDASCHASHLLNPHWNQVRLCLKLGAFLLVLARSSISGPEMLGSKGYVFLGSELTFRKGFEMGEIEQPPNSVS